jgi:phenylacetic acid degradation operon negative regulatory protein
MRDGIIRIVIHTTSRHLPAITPLTARSVAISALLGYHPPALPVSELVQVGGLFGIAERTTRVALTRMAADGDVAVENGVYRLTERLVRRQTHQEESCSPQARDWDGTWEMAVVTAAARQLPERVALRKEMVGLRLAELHEGVWLRPDNLLRGPGATVTDQCTVFTCRHPDPRALAESLWDVSGWAVEARRLIAGFDRATSLTAGFLLVAEVFRHLQLDPYLPVALLPDGWPGDELRRRHAEFRGSYSLRLRDYARAGPGSDGPA